MVVPKKVRESFRGMNRSGVVEQGPAWLRAGGGWRAGAFATTAAGAAAGGAATAAAGSRAAAIAATGAGGAGELIIGRGFSVGVFRDGADEVEVEEAEGLVGGVVWDPADDEVAAGEFVEFLGEVLFVAVHVLDEDGFVTGEEVGREVGHFNGGIIRLSELGEGEGFAE